MALSPTKITPVLDPNCLDSSNAASEVFPPLAGTTTTANDVGAGEQILRNQTHTLNEVKVDIVGDTMTGRLIVGAAAATNHNAIQATGNGSGAGITATGGATGNGAVIAAGGGNNNGTTSTGSGTGSGVRGVGGATGIGGTFLAGGGNNAGVSASGAGTGAGITATGGATGPGITAVNGTAQTNVAPTVAGQFAGYVQLTGTDPSVTTDPGANNVLHGANICKSWGKVTLSGGSPYTASDGYNIASIVDGAFGGQYVVTFTRAMTNTHYSVSFNVMTPGNVACTVSQGTSSFTFDVYDTTSPGTFVTGQTVQFQVFGRQ
jgi:hypothetical protein